MAQLQRDPIVINPEGIKPMYFGQFINNFTNWWNDHDSGRRAWTVIKTGGFQTSVTTQAANYSILSTDSVILIDTTAASRTVTLPTAVGVAGKQYIIKISAGAKIAVIATTSSQTIDGGTTFSLPGQYFGIQVVSDGSNWFVI